MAGWPTGVCQASDVESLVSQRLSLIQAEFQRQSQQSAQQVRSEYQEQVSSLRKELSALRISEEKARVSGSVPFCCGLACEDVPCELTCWKVRLWKKVHFVAQLCSFSALPHTKRKKTPLAVLSA